MTREKYHNYNSAGAVPIRPTPPRLDYSARPPMVEKNPTPERPDALMLSLQYDGLRYVLYDTGALHVLDEQGQLLSIDSDKIGLLQQQVESTADPQIQDFHALAMAKRDQL